MANSTVNARKSLARQSKQPRREFTVPHLLEKENVTPASLYLQLGHYSNKALAWVDELRKLGLNAIFILALFAVSIAIWNALTNDEVIIENIEVPGSIKALGFSDEVLASKIRVELMKIQASASTTIDQSVISSRAEQIDFTVPGAGTSMTSLVKILRNFFELNQKRVLGDVVCFKDPCKLDEAMLELRYIDSFGKVKHLQKTEMKSPQRAFVAVAEQILEVANPYTLAKFYYGDGVSALSFREKAAAIAEKMIATNHVDKAWAYNLLGLLEDVDKTQTKNVRLENAIDYFEMAAKADPTSKYAYGNIASSYTELAILNQEIAKYYNDNNDRLSFETYSEIANEMNAEAEKAIRKGLDLGKHRAFFLSIWGRNQKMLKNYESAEAAFRAALRLNAKEQIANLELARTLRRQDKNHAADEILILGLKHNPDSISLNVELAKSELIDLSHRNILFERAVSMNDRSVYALLSWGLALKRTDTDAAIEKFKTALKIYPNNSSAHLYLGEILLERRQTTEAKQQFEIALTNDPDQFNAKINLAEISLENGEYRAALNSAEDAPLIRHNSERAYLLLANCHRGLNKFPKAYTSFRNHIKYRNSENITEQDWELLRWYRDMAMRTSGNGEVEDDFNLDNPDL